MARQPVRQTQAPAEVIDRPARVERGAHPEADYAEEKGLSLIHNDGNAGELSASQHRASAAAEINAAVILAHRFPRNEDDAHGNLMKSCLRKSFQEAARYQYPRGGKQITGPSVHMAREAARCWKNIRYGFTVVYDDEEKMQIRGYAWDLETNEKVEQDAAFRKLVYRKEGGWVKPDERDLRELVNKHGAIAERNCVLKILPPWLIEDAEEAVIRNLKQKIDDDKENHKRAIVAAFAGLNVSASMIEEYLEHPLSEVTTDELAELRGMFAAIRDGQARWSEYVAEKRKAAAGSTGEQAPAGSKVTAEDLLRRDPGKDETVRRAEEVSTGSIAKSGGVTAETPEQATARRKEELRKELAALEGSTTEPPEPSGGDGGGDGTVKETMDPEAERRRQIAGSAQRVTGGAPVLTPESPPLGKTTEGPRPDPVKPVTPAAPPAEQAAGPAVKLQELIATRPKPGNDRLEWYGRIIKKADIGVVELLREELTNDRTLSEEEYSLLDEMAENRLAQ